MGQITLQRAKRRFNKGLYENDEKIAYRLPRSFVEEADTGHPSNYTTGFVLTDGFSQWLIDNRISFKIPAGTPEQVRWEIRKRYGVVLFLDEVEHETDSGIHYLEYESIYFIRDEDALLFRLTFDGADEDYFDY